MELPAIVRPAGTGDEDEQSDLLVEALLENDLRRDLDPVARARGYQRLLDSGLTVKGVARAPADARQARVREHLRILKLPERAPKQSRLRRDPGAGSEAARAARGIHPGLASRGRRQVLDPSDAYEPYSLGRRGARTARGRARGQRAARWRVPPAHAHTRSRRSRSATAQAGPRGDRADARSAGRARPVRWQRRRQARALGAAHGEDWHAIIVGDDVAAQLVGDYLARTVKELRKRAREERQRARNSQARARCRGNGAGDGSARGAPSTGRRPRSTGGGPARGAGGRAPSARGRDTVQPRARPRRLHDPVAGAGRRARAEAARLGRDRRRARRCRDARRSLRVPRLGHRDHPEERQDQVRLPREAEAEATGQRLPRRRGKAGRDRGPAARAARDGDLRRPERRRGIEPKLAPRQGQRPLGRRGRRAARQARRRQPPRRRAWRCSRRCSSTQGRAAGTRRGAQERARRPLARLEGIEERIGELTVEQLDQAERDLDSASGRAGHPEHTRLRELLAARRAELAAPATSQSRRRARPRPSSSRGPGSVREPAGGASFARHPGVRPSLRPAPHRAEPPITRSGSCPQESPASDSMFSVRETPWHGLGAVLDRPPTTIAEAIERSGLGWRVEREPIAIDRGDAATVDDWWLPRCEEISGWWANVRQDTRQVLGIVGERYRIVQNIEAFQFVDQLIGSAMHFETAGSLHGGRRVWVLARLPEHIEVGGDPVRPYVLLMNSHDGSTAVVAASTPIRVVCQNTLNWGLAARAAEVLDPPHREDPRARPPGPPRARSLDRLLPAVQARRRPARQRAIHRGPAPPRARRALPLRNRRRRQRPHAALARADQAADHRAVRCAATPRATRRARSGPRSTRSSSTPTGSARSTRGSAALRSGDRRRRAEDPGARADYRGLSIIELGLPSGGPSRSDVITGGRFLRVGHGQPLNCLCHARRRLSSR